MNEDAELLAAVVVQLRAVLAELESGDLPAEADQVAWLRGAAAALEQVAEAVS